MKAIRSLVLVSTVLGASALAQTRYCLGGDLDHLSQTQRSACNSKVAAVRTLASALHAPEDWHFVVVCGDEGWKSYTAFVGAGSDVLPDAAANTDLAQHETYLRETRLDLADLPAFRKVIAHEIAGIRLHSTDNAAIEEQAALLLAQTSAPRSTRSTSRGGL